MGSFFTEAVLVAYAVIMGGIALCLAFSNGMIWELLWFVLTWLGVPPLVDILVWRLES